jgi:beta-glucosidase
VKELHGFEKVCLQPGEEKEVQIKIDEYVTSFWDESERKWCSEKGEYKVIVGASCVDPASLVGTLRVEETRWWLGL